MKETCIPGNSYAPVVIIRDSEKDRIHYSRLGVMETVGLRLLFSAFPGGLPGAALLLLRAVIGIATIAQAGAFIGRPDATPGWLLLGWSALAAGCMLLIGFLTPLAGLILGLDVAGISLSALPVSTLSVFDSRTALIFGLTIALAIIGAGPGRFSVDARLFGRREIIIPLPRSSPES